MFAEFLEINNISNFFFLIVFIKSWILITYMTTNVIIYLEFCYYLLFFFKSYKQLCFGITSQLWDDKN